MTSLLHKREIKILFKYFSLLSVLKFKIVFNNSNSISYLSLEAHGTKFTLFKHLSRIGVFGPCWALQPFPSIQSFCLASLEVASGPWDFLFSQLLPLLGLTNGPILLITLFLPRSKAPSIFLEHPCEHKPSFLRNILEDGIQVRHFHCDVGEDGSNVIRVYVPQSIFLGSWPHPERVPCLRVIHRTTHSLSQHILDLESSLRDLVSCS